MAKNQEQGNPQQTQSGGVKITLTQGTIINNGTDFVLPIEVKAEKGGTLMSNVGIKVKNGIKTVHTQNVAGFVEVIYDHHEPQAEAGKTITLRFSLDDGSSAEQSVTFTLPVLQSQAGQQAPIQSPATTPGACTTPPATQPPANQLPPITLWGVTLDPDIPHIRRTIAAIAIAITWAVVTFGMNRILGYNVMVELMYWVGILAACGTYLIMWLKKQSSLETVYAILRAAAIGTVIFLLLNAIFPGVSVRNIATAKGRSEYPGFARGVYPLGVNSGEITGWILPQGKSYSIDSRDYEFSFITPDGREVLASDKNNWPRNTPFKIYAKNDQRGAVLVIN